MTDQDKINLLGEALNNLMQSADHYIDDGSWIDELSADIDRARSVINTIRLNNKRRTIREAVGDAIKGNKS